MKINQKICSFLIKKTENLKVSKSRMVKTYVSFFLIIAVLVTATVSWFTARDTATITSETFSMQSASGLRVNEGEDITNTIKIENFKLDEASSVDGRNVYFPLTGVFTTETANMLFREATVGDQNVRYVYKDFVLSGDSAITYVYIKSYSITAEGGNLTNKETFDGSTEIIYNDQGVPLNAKKHKDCPIRIAFITDSAYTPSVIDPKALVENHAKKYNAVESTDTNGVPVIRESGSSPFSDYYFGNNPIFEIRNGQPINVTMVAWLEGTDPICEDYIGADLSISIELESNWENMDIITFVDETRGDGNDDKNTILGWINGTDNIVTMTYVEDGISKTVVMKYEGKEFEGPNTDKYGSKKRDYWTAPLPKSVTTNITFNRYSISSEEIFNAWYTRPDINNMLKDSATWIQNLARNDPPQTDRGNYVVYWATNSNGNGKVDPANSNYEKLRLAPCLGYWMNPDRSRDDDPQQPTQATQATQATQTTTQQATTAPVNTVKASINLNIPDGISWMRNDLKSGGNYQMHVVFSDGTDAKMTYNNGVCTVENIVIPYGTSIKYFYEKNTKDNTSKDAISITPKTFTSTRYLTYEVTEYGTKANLVSG